MKKDIRLSSELQEIFKYARELAISNKIRVVTLELFVEEVFIYYAKQNKGQISEFNNYLHSISAVERAAILGIVRIYSASSVDTELKKASRYKLLDFVLEPENIILDDTINSVLSDIGEEKNLFELDTCHLMSRLYEEYSEMDIFKSLSSFKVQDAFKKSSPGVSYPEGGMTGVNLNKLLNNGAELKEKRIEMEDGDQVRKDMEEFEKAGSHEEISSKPVDPNSTTPFLDQFSFDMSNAERSGKYDPVVGRELEIDQIIKILCCRIKRNAVLLGDAGVGKTAIVESLVGKINRGEVPEKLIGKRICSLDLNALVSGTKYRGEYEARLQGIIKEVCSHPEIIIYIDEFHNLVGNGSSSENGDGANILKPYLARGEFQCIGSTTTAEYRKFIEKDGALKRRFQNVQVDEPGNEETLKILKKVSQKYEEYHKVRYSDEVLKLCVSWSGRYITDRFFPDKAVDCIDRAGATAGLRNITKSDEINKLTSEVDELKKKKIAAVEAQDFEEAAKLRDLQKDLEKDLMKKTSIIKRKQDSRKNWVEVTIDDVASEISRISKVPIDKIRSTDRTKIKDMKKVLSSKVIGQEEAVGKILISLQRNIMGFRDESKPIASFLLCGQTGIGKSYISKIVAKEFFGSDNSLVRIDCGELSDGKASVSKLTGSTPGYVGYDDEPLLEQIRRKPFSVLLVDEVDKAVPEAFNIFMNILDEGYCILGNGERVDFRNTIIIFTGNIGTSELTANGSGLGFNSAKNQEEQHKVDESIVKKAISKFFRPEFLNRLTGTVVFNSLTKDDLKSIFTLEIIKVKKRISKNGYTIKVTSQLRDHVIESCDTTFGARDLSRNITAYIENELCNALIDANESDLENLKSITLDWVDNHVATTFDKK